MDVRNKIQPFYVIELGYLGIGRMIQDWDTILLPKNISLSIVISI